LKKLFIGLTIVALLGFACGGSAGNPEATVNKFFDAMKEGDADAAAECVLGGMTDEEKEIFATMAPFMAEMEIETNGFEIDGDAAIVYIELKFMGETQEDEVDLVLEDGQWKLVEGGL